MYISWFFAWTFEHLPTFIHVWLYHPAEGWLGSPIQPQPVPNIFFSPPLQRLITGIKPLRLLVGRFPTVGTSLLLTREPTKTAGVVNQPDSLYRDSRSSSCKEAEEEAPTQPKQQEAPANQPALPWPANQLTAAVVIKVKIWADRPSKLEVFSLSPPFWPFLSGPQKTVWLLIT